MNPKILLLFSLLFSLNLYSQQWELVSPKPNPSLLNISIPDSMHIRGYNNKIFSKSDDGGNTWISTNLNIRISDIFFIDSLEGWLVCDSSRIRHTVDGGLSWNAQSYSPPAYSIIKGLQFVTKDTGFFVNGTKLFYTHNNGNTWTGVNIPVSSNFTLTIQFINSKIGWIAKENDTLIYKTIDGGLTWNSYYISSPFQISYKEHALHFIDSLQGWMTLRSNSILKTIDGGITWQNIPSGKALSSIQFKDSLNGFMIDVNGIYISDDGGLTWNFSTVKPQPNADAKFIILNNTYFYFYGTRLYKSNDIYQSEIRFRSFS